MVRFSDTVELTEYLLTDEEREHKKDVYRFCTYMTRLNKHEQRMENRVENSRRTSTKRCRMKEMPMPIGFAKDATGIVSVKKGRFVITNQIENDFILIN